MGVNALDGCAKAPDVLEILKFGQMRLGQALHKEL